MLLPYIYFGLILLNIFIYITGKEIKAVSYPSALFLILFAMGKKYDGSMIGYDYTNYQHKYENILDYNTAEIGYKFTNLIGNSFGLPYEVFYMIFISTLLILIFVAVIRIGGNIHFVVSAYLLYFVLVTIDLQRNQFALAILLITIFPLVSEKIKSIRRVILGIIAASLFHISFAMYIVPFLLAYRYPIKKAWNFLIAMLVLIFVLKITSSASLLEPILSYFTSSNDYASERYEKYFAHTANLSFFAPLAIYMVLIGSLVYWRKKIVEKPIFKPNRIRIEADYIMRFMLYSSMFVTLTTMNAIMYRYVRDVSFIGIIYLSIYSKVKYSSINSRMLLTLSMVAMSIGWFIFDIVIKGYWIDYLSHFFNNDILNI